MLHRWPRYPTCVGRRGDSVPDGACGRAALESLPAIVLVGWARDSRRRKLLAGVSVAVIAVVGISCAATTRGPATDRRNRRLKGIAASARCHDVLICEFRGPE